MEFVDTHAHIHFNDYGLDPEETWQSAQKAGVTRMLAVGCDEESSINGVKLAKSHDGIYAAIGIHPHYATDFMAQTDARQSLESILKDPKKDKIVAIGEFGLDYYYENSDRQSQIAMLRLHLDLVHKYDLPACFHIRPSAGTNDAYDDFWPIFEEYFAKQPIRGVLHSFTATETELNKAKSYGLYVAFNGIMTFTRDEKQLETAKIAPLDMILLETDAPFLTPKPFRGKICKPEHVVNTAQALASLRGESLESLSKSTTNNAKKLFNIK